MARRQVKNGEIHRYYLRKNRTAIVFTVCCDCGLTHMEEFLPRSTYIRVRVWRDEEGTKANRGKRKVIGKKRR